MFHLIITFNTIKLIRDLCEVHMINLTKYAYMCLFWDENIKNHNS